MGRGIYFLGRVTQVAILVTLKGKMLVKSKKEKLFETYVVELSKMINGLETFLGDTALSLAESDALGDEKDCDEEEVKRVTTAMDTQATAGEHHVSGAKGAKTRFSALTQ